MTAPAVVLAFLVCLNSITSAEVLKVAATSDATAPALTVRGGSSTSILGSTSQRRRHQFIPRAPDPRRTCPAPTTKLLLSAAPYSSRLPRSPSSPRSVTLKSFAISRHHSKAPQQWLWWRSPPLPHRSLTTVPAHSLSSSSPHTSPVARRAAPSSQAVARVGATRLSVAGRTVFAPSDDAWRAWLAQELGAPQAKLLAQDPALLAEALALHVTALPVRMSESDLRASQARSWLLPRGPDHRLFTPAARSRASRVGGVSPFQR